MNNERLVRSASITRLWDLSILQRQQAAQEEPVCSWSTLATCLAPAQAARATQAPGGHNNETTEQRTRSGRSFTRRPSRKLRPRALLACQASSSFRSASATKSPLSPPFSCSTRLTRGRRARAHKWPPSRPAGSGEAKIDRPSSLGANLSSSARFANSQLLGQERERERERVGRRPPILPPSLMLFSSSVSSLGRPLAWEPHRRPVNLAAPETIQRARRTPQSIQVTSASSSSSSYTFPPPPPPLRAN